MCENRFPYVAKASPLKNANSCATLDAQVRAELEELERRLIPLLVTVQRTLGKEPTVLTQDERRRYTLDRRRK